MELQRRYVLNALHKLNPSNGFHVEDTYETLQWFCDKKDKPTKKEFNDAVEAEKKIWEDTQYQRDREAEYPTIQELVVALYDTDDKADIEAKRADVKKKYPKPE